MSQAIESGIKPYYQDDAVTLYRGDCREILPTLPRHDLLLTDPPYGIGEKWAVDGAFETAAGKLWGADSKWDAKTADFEISLALEIADRSIIWGGNYYDLKPSRGYLVWDKMQTGFSLADSELAWCSWPATPRTYRFARAQLASEGKVHPTQKPLGLMRFCIDIAGQKAKTILDPFAGSGTTGVAAKLEGRKATLIEMEERYCEIAANRLSQGVLF
jgi:DNA modification methylase